jgi:general secretion pathway protein I
MKAYTTVGLTMLEVLVSLAIFALAVVALGATYANTMGANRSIAEETRYAGDWRLVRQIVLSEPNLEKVIHGGRLSLPDGREVSWALSVQGGRVADLFDVTMNGEIKEAGRPTVRHEENFRVLRPSWTAPGARNDSIQRVRHARQGGGAP